MSRSCSGAVGSPPCIGETPRRSNRTSASTRGDCLNAVAGSRSASGSSSSRTSPSYSIASVLNGSLTAYRSPPASNASLDAIGGRENWHATRPSGR